MGKMSTIASPRQSLTISSRRTSTSTDRSASATRPIPAPGTTRRNRAALRDYYNLKVAASTDGGDASTAPGLDAEQESELDQSSFDPEAYVKSLLAREGLEGVLKVEAGLISEVRNLDGEKKAMVYDNYSKLIAATDTIRSMREKMDPMTPTTRTLGDDIGRIALTASTLSKSAKQPFGQGTEKDLKKRQQQQTVKWALDTPRRLREQVAAGHVEQANSDWQEIQSLLNEWREVKGVNGLREACLDALKLDSTG
ncbi:Hypothetical protein R9X50_00075600 [Acrodontium crateriforme]|uniref:Vacuolar protein sorting-associated protein 51 homolog n=1 Tax=Acrodontium crateriforme TaxID=150365 RepID=A0AAQ3R568_9PEZI|nr:Hypothetical protein R9X50_00075600 [Acrodontium crateriforme]